MKIDLSLEFADYQATLLALALLSIDRPGWEESIVGIVRTIDDPHAEATYEAFREANSDRRERLQLLENTIVGLKLELAAWHRCFPKKLDHVQKVMTRQSVPQNENLKPKYPKE